MNAADGKLVFPKTRQQVEDLAQVLLNGNRDEPVVVVACHQRPSHEQAAAVRTAAGCDVYFLCDYDLANALVEALPDDCGVYASRGQFAGRVYPPGTRWATSQWLSRFTMGCSPELAGRVFLDFVAGEVERSRDRFLTAGTSTPTPLAVGLPPEVLAALEQRQAELEQSDPRGEVSSAGEESKPEPPDSRTPQKVEDLQAEVAALQNVNDTLRRQLEAMQMKLREHERIARQCRCSEIDEAGAPAEAIRRAEAAAEEAVARARSAEKRADRAIYSAKKLKESKKLLPWIASLGMTEEQLARWVMHCWWESEFDADARSRFEMRPFGFAARFFESLQRVDQLDYPKLVRALVEIASGRALSERTVDGHPARTGPGGNDPQVWDAELGLLDRFMLEKNTPGAHRLHAWRGEGQGIVFGSVQLHDDPIAG